MISLTLTRTGLSLPDLTATNTPPTPGTAGAWLPEDGLARPDTTWRYTTAQGGDDMHGAVLLGAVKEMSALPASLYFQGTDAASLRALEDEWTEALEQWSYTVTLTIDGQAATYSADPTSPRWGEVDSGMVRAHLSRASVVVPVYPIPGV